MDRQSPGLVIFKNREYEPGLFKLVVDLSCAGDLRHFIWHNDSCVTPAGFWHPGYFLWHLHDRGWNFFHHVFNKCEETYQEQAMVIFYGNYRYHCRGPDTFQSIHFRDNLSLFFWILVILCGYPGNDQSRVIAKRKKERGLVCYFPVSLVSWLPFYCL